MLEFLSDANAPAGPVRRRPSRVRGDDSHRASNVCLDVCAWVPQLASPWNRRRRRTVPAAARALGAAAAMPRPDPPVSSSQVPESAHWGVVREAFLRQRRAGQGRAPPAPPAREHLPCGRSQRLQARGDTPCDTTALARALKSVFASTSNA